MNIYFLLWKSLHSYFKVSLKLYGEKVPFNLKQMISPSHPIISLQENLDFFFLFYLWAYLNNTVAW